ncbi:MAG: hypothetical protein R6X29_12535 [Acidimicrobiia bacterium]|jgi:hypothetical protein
MPYRWIYAGLGLLAVAAIALGVAFGRSGEPQPLPRPFEAVYPGPGDTVIRQTSIEVDLEFGYRAEIHVDGFRLPDSEVTFVEATGVYAWSPSPTSLYLDAWAPGEHVVRVVWVSTTGRVEAGEFEWRFRVQ